MSVWTRMADWFGVGQQRAAAIDPVVAALTQRYGSFGLTPVTPESAARKIAIGASIRVITNSGRTMPVHAFTGAGGTTKQLTDSRLLSDPDGTQRGISDLVAQALWSLAARGNLMIHILGRDGNTQPTGIEVLNPDLVTPQIDSQGALWWKTQKGPLIPGRNVLHRRLYPVPGQTLGLSPIEQHAASIGVGIAAEKFGGDFFEGGGHPTGLLSSDAPLTEDQAKNVKTKFKLSTESREPVLMAAGIKYTQIQIAPGESQFLDAQGYSSAECARIFGPGMPEMLGYQTGDAMTYKNVVDRDLQFLKLTLDPYLVLVEDVLTACMPARQYVKINRDSLLRMTPLDRFKIYQLQQLIGFAAPNEQRDHEDLPPVSWGDQPYPISQSSKSVSETITDGTDSTDGAPAKTGEPQ